MPLLDLTDCGLYCSQGDFYVDPWKPVDRAIITHAHSDHARWGMGRHLCAKPGAGVLRQRVGTDAKIDTVAYGESFVHNGVKVSLHPAGHILGSAQIRIEHNGEVWVVSGDYKTEADPTCEPFELVRCNTFITESTFGLPIYRWLPEKTVFDQIHAWWRGNQAAGKASILEGYALGKAQRALAGLDPSIGPIFIHGAVKTLTDAYLAEGVRLPETKLIVDAPNGFDWSRAMIVAPPGAHATPWGRKFGDQSAAFLSGWMRIRGTRRRKAVDRGFVLSDHVDWPALLNTIEATGAERVWVTHGYSSVVARYLQDKGLDAKVLPTRWEGEMDSGEEEAA
ncbi:MAG TPA: ligase-associated DNA damage response exonuclease [Fimbriimonas sp.]|nr:ligase-associated DNA damage response exonuclease [Fimbriimonas sp.]